MTKQEMEQQTEDVLEAIHDDVSKYSFACSEPVTGPSGQGSFTVSVANDDNTISEYIVLVRFNGTQEIR